MKILDEIRPAEKEKQKVRKIIKSVLEKIKIMDAKLELGGSYAKDTFLSGNHDIDVFVKFPYLKYKNKDISSVLNEILLIKHKKIHGSRDYFQIEKKGYSFEFIPVLDIKNPGQAKNITDFSPLHTKWVRKNLKNPDEARLIKKFCRAQEVYGAESYIKGFSGYVLEILAVYYKDFYNLIKNVSKWKLPVYIDIEKHYKNKNEAFKKINKSKRENDFLVVDPVQKDRNAAAAISKEKIEKFISSCKEYLHNPSDDFFVEKEININDLIVESGENKLLIAKIKPLKGKRDIAGSKVLKIYSYLENKLRENEFKIIKSGWYFNRSSMVYYIVKDENLSEKIIHYGPPVKYKEHVNEFKKKYINHRTSKGKVYAELRREIRTLRDFMKRFRKDSYVKSNIRKIKFKIY